jgi:hypothetical protein
VGRRLHRTNLRRRSVERLRQLRNPDAHLRLEHRNALGLDDLQRRRLVSAQLYARLRVGWHPGLRRQLRVDRRLHRTDMLRRQLARLRQLRPADAQLRHHARAMVGLVDLQWRWRLQAGRQPQLWQRRHADLSQRLSVGQRLHRPRLQRRAESNLRQLWAADPNLQQRERCALGLVCLQRRGRLRFGLDRSMRQRRHADLRRQLSVGARLCRSDLRRAGKSSLRQLRHAKEHVQHRQRKRELVELQRRGRVRRRRRAYVRRQRATALQRRLRLGWLRLRQRELVRQHVRRYAHGRAQLRRLRQGLRCRPGLRNKPMRRDLRRRSNALRQRLREPVERRCELRRLRQGLHERSTLRRWQLRLR